MIAMLSFSAFAALLVLLAGRRDVARDPRFTGAALAVLAVFPVLLAIIPKTEVEVPLAAAAANGDAKVPWMATLLLVWALGFLIMGGRLLWAVRGLARWRKQSRLIGREGKVEIRQLASLRGPVAAGVFRPVVFVPGAWDAWSLETRRIVLAHEMAHHHRRDPLWRWVAEISCMVNGGNPLVLWMARRLALQCEFSCDKRLLEDGIPARDYARLLCDLAESKAPVGPALAMAHRSSLEIRVRRLMTPRKRLSIAGFLLFLAPALVFAGAVISFKPVASIPVPPEEVELRLSANPFPGEN